jgi:hypothetical protein
VDRQHGGFRGLLLTGLTKLCALVQAFGAVAPQRQPTKGRFLKVSGAIAMAMALTALIVLAGSPSDMDGSAMQAEWSSNYYVDPQRVALAQQMMRGNSAIKYVRLTH